MRNVSVGDNVFESVTGNGRIVGVHQVSDKTYAVVAWAKPPLHREYTGVTSSFINDDGFDDDPTVVAEIFNPRWVWKDIPNRWEIIRIPKEGEIVHDIPASRTGRVYETPMGNGGTDQQVQILWFEKKEQFSAIVKMEVTSHQAGVSMKRLLAKLLEKIPQSSLSYNEDLEIWVVK